MEQDLYKNRSFSACIRSAYTLLTENFTIILSRIWLPTFLYALFAALSFVLAINNLQGIYTTGNYNSMGNNTIETLVSIVSMFFSLWIYTRIFTFLNGQKFSLNLNKIVKLFVAYFLFAATLVFLFAIGIGIYVAISLQTQVSQPQTIVNIVLFTIAFMVVFGLVCLPISYFIMKYMNEDNLHIHKHFFPVMRVGYRYYGLIFSTLFFSQLIFSILMLIIFSPLIILGIVLFVSSTGLTQGDASGLPSYFPYLIYLFSVVACCLSFIGYTWMIIVMQYLYGSIETRENARLKQKGLDKVAITEE